MLDLGVLRVKLCRGKFACERYRTVSHCPVLSPAEALPDIAPPKRGVPANGL